MFIFHMKNWGTETWNMLKVAELVSRRAYFQMSEMFRCSAYFQMFRTHTLNTLFYLTSQELLKLSDHLCCSLITIIFRRFCILLFSKQQSIDF